VVQPTTSRALTIRNVTSPIAIDRVGFVAASAVTPGESSIAGFVVGSSDVTLTHTDFIAGDGAPGIAGEAVPAITYPTNDPAAQAAWVARAGAKGQPATEVLCSDTAPCTGIAMGGWLDDREPPTCPSNGTGTSAQSWGGPGGHGGNLYFNDAATAGGVGSPIGPASGGTGAAGASPPPADGATVGFGAVDRAGYSPTNRGTDGSPGGIGQAGGGGDGGATYRLEAGDILLPYYVMGGGGGQGGAGGCGGWRGKGGGGGGASIALLIVDSMVSLSWAGLSTGSGGPGGAGSVGGAGGPGAPGGQGGLSSCASTSTSVPCTRVQAQQGGAGGPGGKGGDAGPGGGGPSIPLVVSGFEPALTAIRPLPGSGGVGASDANDKKAADGLSQDRWPQAAPTSADGGVTDGATSMDGSNG
jgi:hypothetical protein